MALPPHTPLRAGPFRKGLPLKALSLKIIAFAVVNLPDLIDRLIEAEAHAFKHGVITEGPHTDAMAQAAE